MRGPAGDQSASEEMLRYDRRVVSHTAAGRTSLDDDLSRDGILYEPAIVGEAAGRVSEQYRSSHAEVPWRPVIGQRSILVHVYDQLNVDRLWAAVEAVPELIRQIEQLLSEFDPD